MFNSTSYRGRNLYLKRLRVIVCQKIICCREKYRMRTTVHSFYFWLENHEGIFVQEQRGEKLSRAGFKVSRITM
jgi:hypothetical protein